MNLLLLAGELWLNNVTSEVLGRTLMRINKKAAGLLVVGALAASLTACGGSSSNASTAGAPASAAPVADIQNLSGKMTQVTLDPSFLAGLTALKLTPGLIGTGKLDGAVLTFPITGGSATYYTPGSRDPYVTGSIKHDGSGLTLTDGTTKVGLENFVIDPGGSVLTGDVTANGASVVKGAPLFFLDGSTLKPLVVNPDGTAVLEGTTVSLTKAAADLLNKTFKTTALAEFFKVGIAKITLNTK